MGDKLRKLINEALDISLFEERMEDRHLRKLINEALDEERMEDRHLRKLINEALDILERNGAVRVRTWGKMDVLLKVLDKTTAAGILYYLQRRPDFTRRFVFECLPRSLS